MSKLKENTIINNEVNIDLESNNNNIDNPSEVPEQKNMKTRMNAELVYAMLENLQEKNTEKLIDKLDSLINEIQKKIHSIEDIQLLLEFKLIQSKSQFRRYNFILLMLTVFLTFLEVLYKQFNFTNSDSDKLISGTTKDIVILIPIIITSSITLLSAWIKSFKFEEVIENITRGIEKSITTKLKLGKIGEVASIMRNMNSYDINAEQKIDKLINEKYKNALNDYLEAYTIADKNYTPKDLSKYLSHYLKTKKNEKKLHIGKQKIQTQLDIDMQKIQTRLDLDMQKINIKHKKEETYNKLKEYKYRKNEIILDNKLDKLNKFDKLDELKNKIIVNDDDISDMIEKEKKLYTKIKKFINYLFNK